MITAGGGVSRTLTRESRGVRAAADGFRSRRSGRARRSAASAFPSMRASGGRSIRSSSLPTTSAVASRRASSSAPRAVGRSWGEAIGSRAHGAAVTAATGTCIRRSTARSAAARTLSAGLEFEAKRKQADVALVVLSTGELARDLREVPEPGRAFGQMGQARPSDATLARHDHIQYRRRRGASPVSLCDLSTARIPCELTSSNAGAARRICVCTP